ncbi:MAG: aminotransferase class V-fold PLP-dependent enzyme [Lachnospiraceae bacterium]|nr:aminotransferase class V-fold PLP-dependent enzyme [Lachnospiraceae bacterium]
MKQPLFQKLKEYDKTMLPMHMPGHKRNLALSGTDGYLAALCADCDITEIAGFDNLAEPEGILLSLKERAAKLWKSEAAYPLVNGSTCGILAAIYATVPYGGSVIVARNCHKSVYNGLELVNAKMTYLMPAWDETLGCYGEISPETVEKALEEVVDVKLVIVTSPTYEGVLSDIEGICEAAHAKGVPVLVDSAHGAHLGFGAFPKSAVACGADIVVQSLHKTLPCLTQTALLHCTGNLVSDEKIQAAINMFQTSSPSYLLLASIDGCIGLLETRGEELFAGWEKALNVFYKRTEGLKHLSVGFPAEEGAYVVQEPGKIVISAAGTNLNGAMLMEKLRKEYHIELEMAAEQYAIAMTGMGDTEDTLLRLAEALTEIDATCGVAPAKKLKCPALPVTKKTIGEAMCAEVEEVPLEGAAGRVAAEHLWAYPPGIPVVVAGEAVTEELVEFLTEKQTMGVELHRKSGVCKGELLLRVVKE